MVTCKHCQTKFEGTFCPNCGEKNSIERITFLSIFTSAFENITQMDKGFLFNVKNLTIHPKETIQKYIDGKRKYIFNPISYAIVTISVFIIVNSIFKPEIGDVSTVGKDHALRKLSYNLGTFMAKELKYFWLSLVLYLSGFTWLFFRRYNFVEHLAINFFIVGQATLLGIITMFWLPILVFNPLVYLYIIFLLYQFFKRPKTEFETGIIAFFSFLLSLILFFVIPLSVLYIIG